MSVITDLTGQRFGKLIVTKLFKKHRQGYLIWECSCDCGEIKNVAAQHLHSGATQSCGCLRKKDVTGQKFGKLTAIRPLNERFRRSIVWECQCECGNIKNVALSYLAGERIRSCGCIRTAGKALDIVGQKYGRLTAIKPTTEKWEASIIWECECECGNFINTSVTQLHQGNVKSCGCMRGRPRKIKA